MVSRDGRGAARLELPAGRVAQVPITVTNTGRLPWDSHARAADAAVVSLAAAPTATASSPSRAMRTRVPGAGAAGGDGRDSTSACGRRGSPAATGSNGTSCRKGGCGSAPSRARCGRCRARPSPAIRRRTDAVTHAAAAADRAAGTAACCGAPRCGCSPRIRCSASVPTTSVCSTAPTPASRRPTRGRTATTCISRCSPAAACSSARRFAWLLWRAAGASRALRAPRGRAAAWRAGGSASRPRCSRSRCTRSVDSFLSFAPTYVLFSLTLGCAVACARGAETWPMRIAFDGTALRPGPHRRRLLHRAPAAPPRAGRRRRRADRRLEPADRHHVAAAVARCGSRRRRARVPRLVWMQTLAVTALRDVERRRRALHQRHGAADVAGADGRDDSRHEPEAVSALPPAAARAAEPAAGRSRGAPRRRDHHAVGKRQARHRPPLRPRSRAACTSSTRRRRRRSRAFTTAPSSSGCARRYGLAERIILYVGTIEPRKNLPTLIDAFAARRRAGELQHQLVCVGPYGWLSRGIDEQIARSRSRDAITLHRLRAVRGSAGALQPRRDVRVSRRCTKASACRSIEAMACGAPVITGTHGGAGRSRRRRRSSRSIAIERRRARPRAGRAGARAAIAARSCRRRGLQRARDVLVGARRAREPGDLSRDGATRGDAAARAGAERRREAAATARAATGR